MNETISLRVPAAPAYGRIVRAAGANMATRLGWKAVDIGALRAAIDEAAAALVGEAAGGVAGRELTVTFGVDGKAIALAITLDQPLPQPVPADRCTRFETATAGRYRSAELDAAAHRAHIVVNPT